jgi:uncharacterized repeat protein (TIGR03847 family)
VSERQAAARFVPGFVGVPGQRTFLLEVDDAGDRVWYLLEKGQVAQLADQSAELLRAAGLSGAGADLEPGPVHEPDRVQFRIGQIEIVLVENQDLVDVILVPVAEDDAPAIHTISPAQLDAAVRLARIAVAGGRPTCDKCGLAMDPEGHVCPTTNGDLRHHRP